MSVKGSTLKRTVYIGTHICLLVGLLLGVSSIVPAAVAAQSVSWDSQNQTWLSQQSDHFTINFRDGHQSQAAKSLDIAERVHNELLPFFISAPENRTEIVLVDDFDFSNGWATPFPFAQIRLFMSPLKMRMVFRRMTNGYTCLFVMNTCTSCTWNSVLGL